MKITNFLILLSASALITACQCSNNSNKEAEAAAEAAANVQLEKDKAVVAQEMEALIESTKNVKMAPFVVTREDGSYALSEKEKMVKPDYLINPAKIGNMVSLTQKYHVCAMLAVDLVIADLYEMPKTEMKEAIAKLLIDLNDEAFNHFANTPWLDLQTTSDAMLLLIQEEYEAGRETFYWEAVAASLVEQIYILSRDVDKFMPMFNDENVYSMTYNFVYLREGLMNMVSHNHEMASLLNVLGPLCVINAMTVDQFREQLLQLKEDIEKSRAYLLE